MPPGIPVWLRGASDNARLGASDTGKCGVSGLGYNHRAFQPRCRGGYSAAFNPSVDRSSSFGIKSRSSCA